MSSTADRCVDWDELGLSASRLWELLVLAYADPERGAFSAFSLGLGKADKNEVDAQTLGGALAESLHKAIARQRKAGFAHCYMPQEDDLAGVRGRIDMAGTARIRAAGSNKVHCEYDEFVVDTPENRVLKATLSHLLKPPASSPDAADNAMALAPAQKIKARGDLALLADVEDIDPRRIDWRQLRKARSDKGYAFLMQMCRLLLLGIRDANGNAVPLDKIKAEIKPYEVFEQAVRGYFRVFYPDLSPHEPAKWYSRELINPEKRQRFLPNMETDITLVGENKVLIIDTKCYRFPRNKNNFRKEPLVDKDNCFQIESYVLIAATKYWRGKLEWDDKHIEGMLLYASNCQMTNGGKDDRAPTHKWSWRFNLGQTDPEESEKDGHPQLCFEFHLGGMNIAADTYEKMVAPLELIAGYVKGGVGQPYSEDFELPTEAFQGNQKGKSSDASSSTNSSPAPTSAT